MKNKNHLNALIQRLVKEAVANKLGEGQPIGGVKNDHEFDAGRHNVMKAVNIGENEDTCDCGSGQHAEWAMDGNGIPLVKVCPKCKQKKLARYRPEILRPYSQADVDEPIEPDDYEESVQEKIGFDGKYVDDMESGTQVKKVHGLNETDDEDAIYKDAQKVALSLYGKDKVQSIRPLNPVEPNVYGFLITLVAKNKHNPAAVGDKTFIRYSSITNRWEKWDGISKKYVPYLKEAVEKGKPWREIDNGFYLISDTFARKLAGGKLPKAGYERLIAAPSGFPTKKGFVWLAQTALHSKPVWSIRDSGSWVLENGQAILSSLNLDEESGTGAVAGYATPFAFKKKKTNEENKKELVPVYPENYKSVKHYIRILKKPETEEWVVYWYTDGKKNEELSYFTDDLVDAWNTFAIMKQGVDKANSELKEMTGTGAVAGYQTPFAFSKSKEGSSRAIKAAKKYGTVVKSISETEME